MLNRFLILSFLFAAFVPMSGAVPPSDDAQSAMVGDSVRMDASGFDWRTALPYLDKAADLPDEEGIRELLENLTVFRAYIAKEIATQDTKTARDAAVTEKIDAVVHEQIFRRHNIARVDYPLTRQPFPFTFVAALKTTKHQDAYLVLYFKEKSYTAAQVQGKYGAPSDATIFGASSLYTYKLDTATYTAKAAFTIDPVSGEVNRVAISLKRKRNRS